MKITGRLQTFDRATGARLSNKKVDLTKKNRIPVLATGRRERLPELEFERSEWEYFQSLCMKAVADPSALEELRSRFAR